MAKTKLVKRNPPKSRKEPGVMKSCFDDHFSGHITKTPKFKKVIEAIRRKLRYKKLLLFKSDTFRHFMDLDSYLFSDVIIHNLLLRQVGHEEIDEN